MQVEATVTPTRMFLTYAYLLAFILPISDSVVVGIACYVCGFVALSAWEAAVVPELKVRAILPDVPREKGMLTEAQMRVPWIQPLTAERIPRLEDLRMEDIRVGSRMTIAQYISLDTSLATIRGLQVVSPEWSALYNTSVIVYKKRRW